MKLKMRVTALISVSIIALAALNCSNPANNANKQPAPEAAPKPGRWVAQYRSPASLAYAGTYLAIFSYSGISVVSRDLVYVCGDMPKSKTGDERIGVIIKTTDGGQRWTEKQIELPGLQIPTLNAISFVSPDVGWAVGTDSSLSGIVLKTTDAGTTWAAARIAHKEIPTTVFFVDENTGWIGGATPAPGEDEGVGGPSAILATTDGGRTWETQYNVPVSIHRIFFLDKVTGWASGSRGAMYHTTDGGRTWDTQKTELEMGDGPVDPNSENAKQFAMKSVYFTDRENGFAAAGAAEAHAGRVITTSNGGVTWRRTWITVGNGVQDVFFLNPNEGWAVIDGSGQYVYRTVDGGRSWLSESIIFEQDVILRRIGAADTEHVWAVGGGAIFFRVHD